MLRSVRARRRHAGAYLIRAHAVLLLRLPAQHVDARARRQPRARRHRLPLAWRCGCPAARRRSAQMGGEGATWIGQAPFTDAKARLPEPRRRHVLPPGLLAIRAAVAAGGQHHLQDPLQRRGRDDRRPAGRRQPDGAARSRARSRPRARSGSSSSPTSPRSIRAMRGFAAGRHGPPPRRARCACSASCARFPGVIGADLRPDLRGREAPAPQARQAARSAEARLHQRSGLRRLRRLQREVELRVGRADGDRVRPQARDRPVDAATRTIPASKGFCPSFVTVHGGTLRKAKPCRGASGDPSPVCRCRRCRAASQPYGILVTGIGGTGVVTDRRAARHGGAPRGQGLHRARHDGPRAEERRGDEPRAHRATAPDDCTPCASRAGERRSRARLRHGRGGELRGAVPDARAGATRAIVNANVTPDRSFVVDGRPRSATAPRCSSAIVAAAGADNVEFVDATRLATALLGDSIATNLFMLGYALQKGWVPLGLDALERAIELNGVAVDDQPSSASTGAGCAAHDPAPRRGAARPPDAGCADAPQRSRTRSSSDRARVVLAALPGRGLCAAATARSSRASREPRARVRPGRSGLAEAVARNSFKLMAYKDEYEVARLYTDGAFRETLARSSKATSAALPSRAAAVRAAGSRDRPLASASTAPGCFAPFALLARCKAARHALDPFGRTAERRMERELIAEYVADRELCGSTRPRNHALAVEIAALPEQSAASAT